MDANEEKPPAGATFSSSRPEPLAPLERLAPETLLQIVTKLPGLDTLWNLLRASPRAWRLFNDHALFITEGILSGPNSILAKVVEQLVRAVILVRSEAALPFQSLDAFCSQFIRGIIPWIGGFKKDRPPFVTLDRENLPPSMASAAILRSVVATAHQVSALSQSCLASYLARLRDPSFRPLHPLDPNPRYLRVQPEYREPDGIAPWDREFAGTPVQVVDAGQPSWVEEMRALRAMWLIQLLGDMQCLAENKAEIIGWSDEDIETLRMLDPVGLAVQTAGEHIARLTEEIESMLQYVKTLGDATKDICYRLPRPPPAAADARWITALPERNETYMVPKLYWEDGGFRFIPKDRPVLTRGCRIRCIPWPTEARRWGKTESCLEEPSSSLAFSCGQLSRALATPIPGVKFDSFRPLGFAFWDEWRMHLLGLARAIKGPNPDTDVYYFAWESILPQGEAAGLKAEARRTNRSFRSWTELTPPLVP